MKTASPIMIFIFRRAVLIVLDGKLQTLVHSVDLLCTGDLLTLCHPWYHDGV
jgi:hypothetical protein